MIREDLAGPQFSNWQPVSAWERAVRHGHRPGVFLLPNRVSLADTAERALFEKGFASILINGDQIPAAYLPSLLASVWSAGLIVLFTAEKPTLQLLDVLERVAGSSLFDLSADSDRRSREDIAAHMLSRAGTLRIGGPFDDSGKESINV